jgi:sulfonate transport system ATP-binding protein
MSALVRPVETATASTLTEIRERGADAPPRRALARERGLHISLNAVSKAFGRRNVLNGIDLAIQPGQFAAIVGRSGGGKSTLLRVIAGLERADSGETAIDGAPINGVHPQSRLMFQDARLLPWQRVLSNVGVARGKNWREESLSALAAVGLADRAQEWPSVLSGGQRQRVALARALAARPKILLLDEPFGALDALTRADMHRLLERLWRERGFTAVLVTHDVAEAVALGDRVIVISDGAVALDLPIALPRPRARDHRAAALQAQILARV